MEAKLARIEQDLFDVNRRLKNGERQMKEDHDTLVRCEQEHDMFKKSIDNIEKLTNGIHDMLAEIKAMREDLNDIDGRVGEIEKKPAKRWESVITAIIGAVVGIIVGYVFK